MKLRLPESEMGKNFYYLPTSKKKKRREEEDKLNYSQVSFVTFIPNLKIKEEKGMEYIRKLA